MGLLNDLHQFIKANTPRSTRPRVSPSTVFNQGLLNPNQFNAPQANRLKDSAFGLLGIVPGVGDVAAGVEAADLYNRGHPYLSGLSALGTLPLIPAIGGVIKNIKPTKFEKANQIAQKNAVDMLGLPPDNTAADRAKAMGAVDYFHGTERLDRLLSKKGLDPKRATSGPMPFGTSSTELASSYAVGKPDTSRIAMDEGNVADYFTVAPKSLGYRGTYEYPVERTWYHLNNEQKQTIVDRMKRIGYENPDNAEGALMLHPEGVNSSIAGDDHWNYVLKHEAKGNPLTAIRNIWHDSGTTINNPEELANIYKLAGYPYPINQTNAPWFEAKGILTGKAMMKNPLDTSNTQQIQDDVIPRLKQLLKNDRTRLKQYGTDAWDKNTRYTPKQWVEQLENDLKVGANSYVYTSIPDKVTDALKQIGYDGILDKAGKGGGQLHDVVIPFAPNQVRSKFAAFDPARAHESDLLAGLAPYLGVGGLLGLGLYNRQDRTSD